MTTRTIPSVPVPEPSAAEVRAALDDILASDIFARVERPSRFLRHLVESALQGQQTLLKESVLGIQVFGRDPSWDSRLDPVVRQEAARLRKRLDRYYETATPEVRIELPVGTYIPVFRRVFSEPAPPEAVVLTPPSQTVQPWKRRRVWLVVLAGILLVAAALGARRWFTNPPIQQVPSIVVLPFTTLGDDPANEYFAAGLTDETTDELSQFKGLTVIARTSARAFKGRTVDVREIGRQLNVTYALEGNVERSGDQVKISARVERVSDGARIWSQTYDRPAKELLTILPEMAVAIAGTLRARSGPPPGSRHVPNLEAHELYLRASFELQNLSPESFPRAEQDFRRAVALDPGYAEPWCGLAIAAYNLPSMSGRNRTPAELAAAKDLYRKALDLDPGLPAAHADLGLIAMTYDWDWKTAEREFQLASSRGPNSAAENLYSLLLSFRGHFPDGDRHIELARTLDPVNSVLLLNMVSIRYWEGRFPEAIGLARQILARNPNQLGPQLMLNLSLIESGQEETALGNLSKIEARFPAIRFERVMALARSGHREEGLLLLRQLEKEYEQDTRVFRQWIALAWASLGDHAETMKWLKRSADLCEFQVLNLAVNPAFAEMRNDPEFRALVKRIGLE